LIVNSHWIRWPSRARARASSAQRQLIIDMRGVDGT
jgi:hypothetical protein